TGTVHITVNVPAEPVTAPDSTVSTDEDVILHGTLPTANAGSDDPATLQPLVNGQPITFGTPITLASGATLTLNANGSYDYNGDTITGSEKQPLGASVTDSFTYTAKDGHGDSGTGTVHITVNIPAEPVTAQNSSAATDEDTKIIVDAAH